MFWGVAKVLPLIEVYISQLLGNLKTKFMLNGIIDLMVECFA
jgi:hypothetical protein